MKEYKEEVLIRNKFIQQCVFIVVLGLSATASILVLLELLKEIGVI